MSLLTTEVATLDNTLGAVFLGAVVSCILFGISTLQVYYYYHYYPHDSFLHKASVAILFILDSLHLALSIVSVYHYGVRGFGNAAGLLEILSPIKLAVAINVVIILLVQSLYTYRVWLLSGYHHGILGYLVTGIVLGGFGIGIVLAYETYTVSSWPDATSISWAIESSFAASTVIDVIISSAMCYYLRKSKGTIGRLNSRISTLMQYTLSCGVFTSACSIACLFTFILMSNNLIFLAMTWVLTRLYVNSFMAMMNARQRTPDAAVASSSFVLSSPSHTHSHSHMQSHRMSAVHRHPVGLPYAYVERSVVVSPDFDLEAQHRNRYADPDSKPGRGKPLSVDTDTTSSQFDWDSVSPTAPAAAAAKEKEWVYSPHSYARAW